MNRYEHNKTRTRAYTVYAYPVHGAREHVGAVAHAQVILAIIEGSRTAC